MSSVAAEGLEPSLAVVSRLHAYETGEIIVQLLHAAIIFFKEQIDRLEGFEPSYNHVTSY